jgi:ABC-2 type transport system permease protein
MFVLANLVLLGYTISTIARTQMQAMQLDLLLLPAVDPALRLHLPVSRHAGMGADHRRRPAADAFPAAWCGAIMLKDTSLAQLQNPIVALCVFTAVAVSIAMLRYRRTLD